MSTPTQPQSSQLGRDALLVHGLACVFAAGAVGTGVWLGMEGEYLPAVAVGAVATFVLIVWSAILAVRALWQGQRAPWPAVVLVLGGLEAAAVCLLLLWGARRDSLVFALGLPVFVPVFVLASLVGVAVAWWRVRRAEKRELDAGTRAGTPVPQGAAPWPRQRCWKRGVAWYAAVTALAVAVLLPFPLFLFCLWEGQEYGRDWWQPWLAEHTPVVVGETTASILSHMNGPTAKTLYARALSTGRVAQARLLSELLVRA